MARRLTVLRLAVLAVLVASASSTLAQNKCAGAKIKAAGKKAKCLLGLESKAAKTGAVPDPVKVQKCKDKLSLTFAKNEAKGGCATTGDAQDIEDKVDAFVEDVVDELDEGLPSGCQSAKLKAAGKKAACLLTLESKEAAKGIVPPPDKVQKCKDKLAAAFAKSEAKGGCGTTGDAQDIEDKVDALVDDVDDELRPACPTPDKQDGCAADEVCNAANQCQALVDFCSDATPPLDNPPGAYQCLHRGDAATCDIGSLNPGTPCCPPGVGGGCDLVLPGDDLGMCVRVHRGGWDAFNALEPGFAGTLGSFPLRDADNVQVFLSNNHVFARSSGNMPPAGGNAVVGVEKINQPAVGPVAGTLAAYEFLCQAECAAPAANVGVGMACTVDADCDIIPGTGVCGGCSAPPVSVGNACDEDSDCDNPGGAGNGVCRGGSDCAAAGGQNTLNEIGKNCIDAAIAGSSAGGAILDILDVGTPAAYMPAAAAGDCPTELAANLIGLVVKKSGYRTGLTCGKVVDTGVTVAVGYTRLAQFINQFQIQALDPWGFNEQGGTLGAYFGCGGDSGSLVVGAATNRPIGLFFAGNDPPDCRRHCQGTRTACAAHADCAPGTCAAKQCSNTAVIPANTGTRLACAADADCPGAAAGSCFVPSGDANPIDLVLRRFMLHF